jgi:hypothetical protein
LIDDDDDEMKLARWGRDVDGSGAKAGLLVLICLSHAEVIWGGGPLGTLDLGPWTGPGWAGRLGWEMR